MSTSPAPHDRPELPRGRTWEIVAGPYRAGIAAVGAIVEHLTVDGRDLLVRNPATGPMQFYRGAVVAPWPNRIGDGRYTWDGQDIQAPLTEPDRQNALHGLVSFVPFEEVSSADEAVTLRTLLYPSPGYPFALELTVEHRVDAETGLTTTVTARNVGDQDAPYGVCPHPYLVAGPEPLDTWTLRTSVGTVMTVTPDRLLPTGLVRVDEGGEFDFREGKVLGSQEIDHAFTDLGRDEQGLARVVVTAPGGTGVEMVADERCPWLQLHTADRPEPENNRLGLAVEPMTCPPDAFRSGDGVIRLAPGASHEAAWSVRGL
ncbi:aldose 1-epimerase family protein [Brachybacterium phenoliresistens]|uniref:Galactose mutarotase n=1 Tax=Brachybacterium phenoliresistens TaxID=396014 RepID=Z9JS17_9MICO|nr:aldose 1-epimerase family protein [Brachybacterium phenoliresistens]EWS80591.1 galactose mutarotase [Brachybacterium phenoliresistens]